MHHYEQLAYRAIKADQNFKDSGRSCRDLQTEGVTKRDKWFKH